jgi:hypothetical protein
MPDILLDDYDSKLLSDARVRREGLRERDLKRRIRNVPGEGEAQEELGDDKRSEGPQGSSGTKTPAARIIPKEDYQVREAQNYLKAFEVFRKMGRPMEEKTSPTESAKTGPG